MQTLVNIMIPTGEGEDEEPGKLLMLIFSYFAQLAKNRNLNLAVSEV